LLIIILIARMTLLRGGDSLPEYQQKQILKGLEETDAGLGTPFDEVTRNLREKYGLNG
jgi:hypothetical protein